MERMISDLISTITRTYPKPTYTNQAYTLPQAGVCVSDAPFFSGLTVDKSCYMEPAPKDRHDTAGTGSKSGGSDGTGEVAGHHSACDLSMEDSAPGSDVATEDPSSRVV